MLDSKTNRANFRSIITGISSSEIPFPSSDHQSRRITKSCVRVSAWIAA
jgi:hypothetical protein